MKFYITFITQSPTPQLPAAAPDEAVASASVVSILTPIMNTMDYITTLHTYTPHRQTHAYTETHTCTYKHTNLIWVQILLPELCRLHHECTCDPHWLKMT